MKALVLHDVKQVLRLESLPLPQLQEGEALVKLKAASFNRRDWWIQQGQYAGLKFPIVLGSDGSGIVEKVNSNLATDLNWLDREVIILPSMGWNEDTEVQPSNFSILGLPQDGTFAEYVKVPISNLFPKPSHLSFEQAAAIPLAGLTAFRALFKKAQLNPQENLLITGVGGGVATFALQWAKAIGANVYVTSGSDLKIQKAIELGALAGENYKNEDWAQNLKEKSGGFDVILDSALGEGFPDFLDLCNPGGRIVFFGGTQGNIPALNGRKIFWKQLQIKGTTMGSRVDFEKMLKLINEKKLEPLIDSVFKIEMAQDGLDLMTGMSQFGKIVMQF